MSQLVVNFMDDAEAGVGEMRRVARRTVTSCVWDYAGEMTMLRAFWDAALELDPDAPDEGRVMRYCTPEELATLWEGAGLREVETKPLVVEARYEDFDDYWSPFPSGIAPSGAYCTSLEEDARAALREALLSPPRLADRVLLPHGARVVRAGHGVTSAHTSFKKLIPSRFKSSWAWMLSWKSSPVQMRTPIAISTAPPVAMITR
jgi:hypothetical protein